MKNKFLYTTLVLMMSIFIYSCEDFIEVDLGKKSITVLAPANNITSSSFNQLFKWESLKGAEQYQLQIVKPNFSSVSQFVLDTTTTSTQFSYILLPGTYQWRLRAMNNSSQTEYQTYNITIDSTLDLSSSTVGLVSPTDNAYTNTLTNTFTWLPLPYADSYVLQISSGASSVSLQSFSATTYTGSYTFTAQGIYQWKVFAQNSSSISGFITRTITVDTAVPYVPVYVSPMADTITVNPIVLKWTSSTTANFSHLQISTDSLFTAVLADTRDTTISYSSGTIMYNFYSPVIGQKYYWRVQDTDFAGNKSAYFYRKRIKRI